VFFPLRSPRSAFFTFLLLCFLSYCSPPLTSWFHVRFVSSQVLHAKIYGEVYDVTDFVDVNYVDDDDPAEAGYIVQAKTKIKKEACVFSLLFFCFVFPKADSCSFRMYFGLITFGQQQKKTQKNNCRLIPNSWIKCGRFDCFLVVVVVVVFLAILDSFLLRFSLFQLLDMDRLILLDALQESTTTSTSSDEKKKETKSSSSSSSSSSSQSSSSKPTSSSSSSTKSSSSSSSSSSSPTQYEKDQVELIVHRTGVDKDTALIALRQCDGDLISAIHVRLAFSSFLFSRSLTHVLLSFHLILSSILAMRR
jgi:NACalpha-BTF3-like transcription factor